MAARLAVVSYAARPSGKGLVDGRGKAAWTWYRSCRQARAAGAAPIHRGSPGYRAALDGDGDGVACEPYY